MVLLSIFLVLLILLFCPLVLKASFTEKQGLSAKISYLFFSFQIVPPKEKKASEKSQKAVNEEEKKKTGDKKDKIQEIIGQRGLSGFLELLKELIKIADSSVRKILKHLAISYLSLSVVVATEDAADTAIRYGQACSVIYPAMSLFVNRSKYCNWNIEVIPDFDRKESMVDLSVKASIRPCFLISIALAALLRLFKLAKRENLINKKDAKDSNLKDKAVQSK